MPTKRFQIHLDPDLHETLRQLAFKRRTTISNLIRGAVEAWLKQAGRRAHGKK